MKKGNITFICNNIIKIYFNSNLYTFNNLILHSYIYIYIYIYIIYIQD